MNLRVDGEILADGSIRFSTIIDAVPQIAASVVVRIDTLKIARFDLGDSSPPFAEFVRTVGFESVLGLNGYDVQVESEGLGGPPQLHLSGSFFFVTSLPGPREFYDRVQMAGTRVGNPHAQQLGAKAAYLRFADYPVRASALTVFGHRIIDRLKADAPPARPPGLDWFVEMADRILLDGRSALEAADVRWDTVRWTLSLATVVGNIHVAGNSLEAASQAFRLCYLHRDLVRLSRVSGLNIINGCFFFGLLSHILETPEQAEEGLRASVASYTDVVRAQDLFENVWVIGDLLNCAITARQAYIVLVRLGFIKAENRVLVDQNSVFDLRVVQSPLAGIIAQGRASDFAGALKQFG